VPDALVDAFTAAQRFDDNHVPALQQAALADFIADGHFGRHVRRMRALYAERGAALVRAVRRELGDALEVRSAHAGLHLVGWLPPGADDRAAAARAAAHGVEAQAVSGHALRLPGRAGLLLGYAAVPGPEIDEGARRLAAALGPSYPARGERRQDPAIPFRPRRPPR